MALAIFIVWPKPPSAPSPKRAPPRCLARETEASNLAAGAPAWRRPPAVPGRRRAGGRLAPQWAGPLRAGHDLVGETGEHSLL